MKTICALILAGLMMSSAQAADVVVGKGVVCSKPEQIETILKATDKIGVVNKINDEAKEMECGNSTIAFIKGKEIKRVVDSNNDLYAIIEIVVLAGKDGDKVVELSQPVVQYIAQKIPGFGI